MSKIELFRPISGNWNLLCELACLNVEAYYTIAFEINFRMKRNRNFHQPARPQFLLIQYYFPQRTSLRPTRPFYAEGTTKHMFATHVFIARNKLQICALKTSHKIVLRDTKAQHAAYVF